MYSNTTTKHHHHPHRGGGVEATAEELASEKIPLRSAIGSGGGMIGTDLVIDPDDPNVVFVNGLPQTRLSKRRSIEEQHQADLQGLPEREKWTNVFEFFLSCIGYSVGLGNIWRFPYLCYKNGGGAFLIPYCISLIFCGVPMFILEASWGQLLNVGGLGIWKLCPLLKGVGWAAVMMAFWLNIYYIIVLGWGIYYFFKSFTLPWSMCDGWWNTNKCRQAVLQCKSFNESMSIYYNQSLDSINATSRNYFFDNIIRSWENRTDWKFCELARTYVTPAKEFWEREVLRAEGRYIDDVGALRPELAITLFLAWVLCYFAIFKGVKWTGKVVYFTAVFPYLLLFILFFRGITLEGAGDGIAFYITPNMTKLLESDVWIEAVSQIFFTYGLALGAIVALGSYNPYHNGIVKQSILICCMDSGTSLFSGFVIFSFIGFMAQKQGVRISEVADRGPSLLFLAYPTGILELYGKHFWSCLFFFMILLIGIDSQFCTMEGFFTALIDEFPRVLRVKYRREMFIAVISLISYLIGLSMMTEGGIYVFHIFDYFSASGWSLLWLMFFECIAISWLYGVNKWYDHLQDMIGYRPSVYWKFCWVFMCPAVCAFVMVFSLVQYEGAKYHDKQLPPWAQGVGWMIALSSMLCVPVYAVYIYLVTPGTASQKFHILVRPDINIGAFREGGTNDHYGNENHHHSGYQQQQQAQRNQTAAYPQAI